MEILKPFSTKYLYNVLNLQSSGDDVSRISKTLFSSKINLTPHQINAALFALKSPFSKGAILADEVGLGKTIEAGIVMAQYWQETKRRILIVAPAALLKQWQIEMSEKFALQSIIIEGKQFREIKKKGQKNPFITNNCIVICSYYFCSKYSKEINNANFDLIVMDEAHKLRNVHNANSKLATNVLKGTQNSKKLLLTATPMQNSILDIYGLSQFIDPMIFGEKDYFKHNYIKKRNQNDINFDLKLGGFIHRTLREQVSQYIKFTNRMPKTYTFKQTEQEKSVYDKIRELLLNSEENIYIIPQRQKHLLLLILCKLMGSSMKSVSYTLENIKNRLMSICEEKEVIDFKDIVDEVELIEEYDEIDEASDNSCINKQEIDREIGLLNSIILEAQNVAVESKYIALQNALLYAFEHLRELGAEEKVIIFSESKRTQQYLYDKLIKDYDGVLTYNGTNNEEHCNKILVEWLKKHEDKGSRQLNVKTAILEEFKNNGKILLSTEAGAEGLNLQFCSLVINYDLPWNPQRVEQRIGRCHRFGQKFDVVVINFICESNAIEKRVYELLENKFKLFTEILGSSDAVLGTLEEGSNIAKSIIDIYTSCRSDDEINEAFNDLQRLFKDDIEASLIETKKKLLDNFDEDLQKYFSNIMNDVNKNINETERVFWNITKNILGSMALFNDEILKFDLISGNKLVSYSMNTNSIGNNEYSMNTVLGQEVLDQASKIIEQFGEVQFDLSNYQYKIVALEELVGKSGYIIAKKVRVEGIAIDEKIVLNGILDNGERLNEELCKKLFRLNTIEKIISIENSQIANILEKDSEINAERIQNEIRIYTNKYLVSEIEKINRWADDRIKSTQLDVDMMREERKHLQKESEYATNLIEKKAIEERISQISKRIKQGFLSLAMDEENIEEERQKMILSIKKANDISSQIENIFLVRFKVV